MCVRGERFIFLFSDQILHCNDPVYALGGGVRVFVCFVKKKQQQKTLTKQDTTNRLPETNIYFFFF